MKYMAAILFVLAVILVSTTGLSGASFVAHSASTANTLTQGAP